MIERSALDWWTTRGTAAPRVASFSMAATLQRFSCDAEAAAGSTSFSSVE
jgi:hypothetical protein